NMSSAEINGQVRAQAGKFQGVNLSTITVNGNISAAGEVKFNNFGSATVNGNIESANKLSVNNRATVSGTQEVVDSIGNTLLKSIDPPTGPSDSRYVGTVTIIEGDYHLNGSLTLQGTVYATGQIHINNGTSIQGQGALVAGNGVHINNISTV